MFSALAIASSGLSAQRVRMDVIAQNLANAETTQTPQGGPYQRRVVHARGDRAEHTSIGVRTSTSIAATRSTRRRPRPTVSPGGRYASTPIEMTNDAGGVRVASIGVDKSDGPMVYNPGSPDADKNGYVHMPNVNMTDEMMDLMNARRLYEANATVFQVARAMLHKAIDI